MVGQYLYDEQTGFSHLEYLTHSVSIQLLCGVDMWPARPRGLTSLSDWWHGLSRSWFVKNLCKAHPKTPGSLPNTIHVANSSGKYWNNEWELGQHAWNTCRWKDVAARFLCDAHFPLRRPPPIVDSWKWTKLFTQHNFSSKFTKTPITK